MAKTGKDEGGACRSATSLSRSIAIAIVMTGSAARAQDAYPPAPDPPTVAQPPPPAYRPPVAQPRPPGPSGFERRHHVGGQIGGTGLVQAVYRLRVVGPFHMEVGALGADHGANFSTGVVIGSPVGNRWFPYVGLGGGFMLAGGPTVMVVCEPPQTTCTETNGEDFAYMHARVGIGVAFGATRRNLISLDIGGWYGRHREGFIDETQRKYETSKMTALPMAGLSYFFAIH